MVVRGVVVGDDGEPMADARVDVWHCDADGLYDVQIGAAATRFRGILTTGGDGRYELRTVVPPPYEVPKDGPVGRLLAALGRHAFRPAHIHYRVQAAGHAELTTMVFLADDPWLGNDVIGADCPELTAEIDRSTAIPTVTFDIHLAADSH